MPIRHLRRLTGKERTDASNRELALLLALIAGAVNAGGFLAVRQYTSHMSGIVSTMAVNLVAGDFRLMIGGAEALCSFLAGAATTAVIVNWARRRKLHGTYAIPLFLEAGLLFLFGIMGRTWQAKGMLPVPETVAMLCFAMGLQNAVITKLSRAEIRTTHVTGMITDIGIQLGRMLYPNRAPEEELVAADWRKVRLLASLVGSFFAGGALGALGFRYAGFTFTIPFAALLVFLAIVPLLDDLRGVPPLQR